VTTDTTAPGLEELIVRSLTGRTSVLVPKLPERLTLEQKRRKVRNLLQELRRAGMIVNLGSRSHPHWTLGEEQQ